MCTFPVLSTTDRSPVQKWISSVKIKFKWESYKYRGLLWTKQEHYVCKYTFTISLKWHDEDFKGSSGADQGFDQGGGAQIVTGLNCQWCTAVSCEQSEPFSAWDLGPGACLRALEALGYFITKYAFSPFWGTFLYYF